MAGTRDQVGVLSIEVVAGRDLVAMDDDGTSDPYVVCIVGAKKKKTKIIRDTLNPQWSVGEPELFKFKVRKDVENIILECYDWDRFNADDRMGLVTIPLANFKDEKLHDEWYTLVPMKPGDEVSGQLHFKIQFTSVVTEKHQKNPLVIAIKAGDLQKVISLLSQADFDPNPVDIEKNTPLHLAAVGSNFKVLSALLANRKVNVKATDSDGSTPLHIFAQKFVSPNHCEEIVAQFVERGADLNAKNTKLDTPLHKACLNVSVRVVMAEALLKRGAKVNEVNVEGERPIDYAIRLGRGDLCDLLIRFGVNPKLEPQIKLAKSLQFHQIADKIQGLLDTYEWCHQQGLDHVGEECLKNYITKDQLPMLTGSALDSLGFKSNQEKDKFVSAASHIGKVEKPTNQENKRPVKKEKMGGLDKRDRIGSLKYGQFQTDKWVIDYESLEFSESLGKGASGQVFLGYYGGKRVAIKTLPSTEVVEEEFMREFQIICIIQAPHIVKFYGACIKPKLCIVMEFCEQGSLHDVLSRPSLKVGWDRVFKWALGTVEAIHSLHHFTPSVMHRDLKSLNVLITSDDTAKVCDFGLSRFDTSSNLGTMQKLRGTYHYVAPELYTGKKFTFQSDVYSIGIILWELVNRCITQKYAYPFSEFPNLTQDFQVLIASAKKDIRPTVPVTCPDPFKNIIFRCYSKKPEERPTTTELKESLINMETDFKKNPQPWLNAIVPL